jgi:hypothetical protein
MNCIPENYKTIAALTRQEATRLERMGMTPSEARKTACLLVGASLTPAVGGADLNNWLCKQMREFLPTKGDTNMTNDIAAFGIAVSTATFPTHAARPGQSDDRRRAMYNTCKHLQPGETIKLSSTDKKLLLYLQQSMKHISMQLKWGNGKGAYRTTLQAAADGNFDLYVQRVV